MISVPRLLSRSGQRNQRDEPDSRRATTANRAGRKLRIAFLLTELSSYLLACCRDLAERHDSDLLVIHFPVNKEAPFALDISWIPSRHDRNGLSDERMASLVQEFEPDALFVAGWSDRGYRKIGRDFRRDGIPVVLGLDTNWNGTVRQRAAALSASLWLHDLADVLWVAGERQERLANKLGYDGFRCWTGVYACDWKAFSEPADSLTPSSFLFVGRYIQDKGLSDLLEAYLHYRQRSPAPWPLYCAGTGALRESITKAHGVTDLGFVQPADLPRIIREFAGALVLPSRFEPWGVVLQEAGASRRPVICSDACGAAPHLAQHLYNGLRFSTRDREQLANCLLQFSSYSEERRREMGEAGFQLASQFTPERWSRTLVEGLRGLPNANFGW